MCKRHKNGSNEKKTPLNLLCYILLELFIILFYIYFLQFTSKKGNRKIHNSKKVLGVERRSLRDFFKLLAHHHDNIDFMVL